VDDEGIPMRASSAVEAVRSAVAAFNRGDIDGYLEYFDPSCERRIMGLEEPLTFTDIGEGLRAMHAAFDGLHLDEDVLFGDERFVCARWRMRGVHVNSLFGLEPSGQAIDVETCEVYELVEGIVRTSWVYGDVGQLVHQLTVEGGDA
jgi:predicted ester cyclase